MSARKPRPQSAPRKAPAQPVAIPVAPRTAWRLILGSVVLLGGAAAIVWAVAAGLPRNATMGVATAASSAGFVVRQVEIEGARNQPRLSIYRELLQGGSDSMLLADLDEMRGRLVALPWVKDAEIQRRWPDRLHITVIERKPAALWQWQGRIRLIDAEGQVLPASDLAPFAQLPLLVGERARLQAPAILKIIASRPDLSGDVQAAVWVGDRRWDVRMKSGETISLPEGAAAAASWLRFADLNTQSPLLGRGFVRFDFRIPDKMVVRVETDPGQTVKPRANPQPAQPQPAQPPAAIAGTQPRAAQPMQMARSAQPQPEEVVI